MINFHFLLLLLLVLIMAISKIGSGGIVITIEAPGVLMTTAEFTYLGMMRNNGSRPVVASCIDT